MAHNSLFVEAQVGDTRAEMSAAVTDPSLRLVGYGEIRQSGSDVSALSYNGMYSGETNSIQEGESSYISVPWKTDNYARLEISWDQEKDEGRLRMAHNNWWMSDETLEFLPTSLWNSVYARAFTDIDPTKELALTVIRESTNEPSLRIAGKEWTGRLSPTMMALETCDYDRMVLATAESGFAIKGRSNGEQNARPSTAKDVESGTYFSPHAWDFVIEAGMETIFSPQLRLLMGDNKNMLECIVGSHIDFRFHSYDIVSGQAQRCVMSNEKTMLFIEGFELFAFVPDALGSAWKKSMQDGFCNSWIPNYALEAGNESINYYGRPPFVAYPNQGMYRFRCARDFNNRVEEGLSLNQHGGTIEKQGGDLFIYPSATFGGVFGVSSDGKGRIEIPLSLADGTTRNLSVVLDPAAHCLSGEIVTNDELPMSFTLKRSHMEVE